MSYKCIACSLLKLPFQCMDMSFMSGNTLYTLLSNAVGETTSSLYPNGIWYGSQPQDTHIILNAKNTDTYSNISVRKNIINTYKFTLLHKIKLITTNKTRERGRERESTPSNITQLTALHICASSTLTFQLANKKWVVGAVR